MKIPILLMVGSALTLACSSAMAESDSNGTGLFLEPGLSYQVTTSNLDFPGATNSEASTNGFGFFGRAGVHVWDRFFVAADARYGLLKFNDNAGNISVSAISWDIAPVVGLQMPDSGPRLYVGYVLGGGLNPASTKNNRDLSFNDATGWRIGAGLKIQYVSVNIEWQRLHYGNSKLATSGQPDLTGINYNGEGLVASVSFPIDFN